MSDTMAEAFCEEYLITWTEHGEDFTGWQHRDIFTRSNRMSRAGAINLFHPLDYDRLMIVTVFPDRSWIVQYEPTDGAPPTLGTREDEHRILDLIHQALDTWLERLAKQTWMDIVAVLAQAKQMSRLEPGSGMPRVYGRAPGASDATNPAGKTGVTLEVAIMNYRLFLIEPKHVYPQLVSRSPSGWWLSGNQMWATPGCGARSNGTSR